jgi:hypothetical protein
MGQQGFLGLTLLGKLLRGCLGLGLGLGLLGLRLGLGLGLGLGRLEALALGYEVC